MPCKKKKYNARFPAGRIKKIMQSDEEIGKVAQAVPVVISRTLELFVESLLTKTLKITVSRNAKTLSTSHMKQCIMAEQRFDFLRELVKNIPDISVAEEAANYNEDECPMSAAEIYADMDTPYDLSMPSTSAKIPVASQNTNGIKSLAQSNQMKELFTGNHLAEGHVQPIRDISSSLHLRISDSASCDVKPALNCSSVIMHTASVTGVNEFSPPKLLRSESLPASSTGDNSRKDSQNNNLGARNRASKHFPTTSIDHQELPAKAQKLEIKSNSNLLPAPIVGLDFYNKPVVKIDYSHLPVSQTADGISPNEQNKNAFNAKNDVIMEPVINIDLTNIVASAYKPIKTATYLTPASSSRSMISKTPIASANLVLPSKVCTDMMFELDEDYDNI